MKIAIMAVVGLLLLGAGVFAGMKFLAPQPAVSAQQQEASKEATEEEEDDQGSGEIVVYPLDTFIVNLDGEGGRRYLKVKMTLEVDARKKGKLDKQLHKVRDAILILLTSKTYEDLRGAEGKYALREEVKGRIGRIVGRLVVKEVYLEEFVVQ